MFPLFINYNVHDVYMYNSLQMSLHVGHIPPHIRQEELQRVFQRFGRCMLQMKDGYGFAVFEFAADAERAFRALRGKNICGEPLSLNWSNRQPRPFPRVARSTKVHEPYLRRNLREEDDGVRIRGSQDQRDFSKGNSHIPAYNRGMHWDDALDRGAVYVPEDINDIAEEKDVTLKEGVADVGNSSEPSPVEIERWGQSVNAEIAGNELRNDTEFDRYEPYHGYDREDEKDNNHRTSSYCSPYHGSSQGKGRREYPTDEADKNIDNSKPQPTTCYKCGLVGHIKRYCPEGDAKREKFSKFSHRRDEINFRGRNDAKLKMPRISSWGRPDASRDPLMILRRQGRNRKESQFGNSRKLVRKKDNFPERRGNNWAKLREESRAKKRSEQHREKPKKARKKRSSRRFDSSSLSSDSSTSSPQTHSGTSKSKSRASFHSTSRSISSRSRSVSSSSRSASVSLRFKSKSSRSRSWSRSSSRRSPTLSVSLEKKSLSCPKNVNVDVSEDRASSKVHLEHPRSPSSKHHLHNNMESFQAKDGNGSVTCKINKIGHSGDNADEAHYSASTSVYKEHNSGINLPKGVAAISDNCREKSRLQETSPVKPNKQIAAGSEGRNSTRITTQEMILALKHYGLPAPEEGESDISVEGYFGAARLWPWEMIYYRRLKKGPISTGNYARRLEQNKEFGIEDRYIRSSSGWGELEQNDML